MLQLPLREAERRLADGDVSFILNEKAQKMSELARIDPSAPFYAALIMEKRAVEDAGEHITALYHEALKSPAVKTAAATRLMLRNDVRFIPHHAKDAPFPEGSPWIEASALFAELNSNPKLSAMDLRRLAEFYGAKPIGEAHRWLFSKLEKAQFFDESAGAARREAISEKDWLLVRAFVLGRMAVFRSSYAEAYRAFRGAFKAEGERIADFFEFPQVLGDLGKTYQYAAPKEGMVLFLEWERQCDSAALVTRFGQEHLKNIRYLLNYYAGRMARQSKNSQEAIRLFDKAVPFAPDERQKDACIWYLFDTAFRLKEEQLVGYVEKYASQWDDGSYFADILDKFSAWASKKRRWELIRAVFRAINRYADSETRAKYAYIYGRALEHGMAKPEKGSGESAADYYRIIYDGAELGEASLPVFYYRALAAERLERPLALEALFDSVPHEDESLSADDDALVFEFLSGFFRFGAAAYSSSYIREDRDKLGTAQLRQLAEKLVEADELHSAVSLSLYYIRRKGYRPARRDLELCFPRGYQDFIEQYADKAGIERALLFALVRRESVFNAAAVSHAGARGLTQLMERTGTEMARILAHSGGPNYLESGAAPLLDPEINTHLGALYYRQLSDMTKSPTLAILAYNGGIGNIRKWKRTATDLPDDLFLETVEFTETRNYGRGVLGDEIIYRYLYYNDP